MLLQCVPQVGNVLEKIIAKCVIFFSPCLGRFGGEDESDRESSSSRSSGVEWSLCVELAVCRSRVLGVELSLRVELAVG